MKTSVEQLTPTRVKLSVEIPFDELSSEFDRAYATLAQQVRIPGFRPGKAPAKLIEARVGRDAVLAQVVNDALPAKYGQAIEEADVKAIGQPDIELGELVDGAPVTFTAEVDVRPEISLPDFASLAVTVDALKSDEDAVAEQLEGLRERFGTLKAVERGAQTGDHVTLDLEATVDGKPVPDATTEGLSHEVGSGQLIDGLDEAVTGLKAGEEAEFTTKLVAGEFADSDATVKVKVGAVKERELPELDDEFAQLASEFDTIDELRESARGRVEQSKKIEQANQIRDKVLDDLLEKVEFPVPETIVDAEVEGQLEEVLHSIGHDEAMFERLLEAQGTTREEFETNARENAERGVRTQLLLDAIADQEETEVSQEELTQQIIFASQRYGMAPQEFVNQLQQAGQIGALYADARRNKALSSIISRVAVTDDQGATVDTAEYFGPVGDAEGDTDDE
ncbi:trigger factor [Gordonia crocea]|uniref:Trigger factor n=1 Tax=Gordonia crocea TaxID=589162 RepID=A0A7I9UWJ5_9ACTN|nr:trigger factor [Gordonia crocea]GED97567.1 trigger factor [Gordonia crocea]